MKKILLATALASTLLSGQAQAGNEGALIGGLIGGLLIGGALSHHHEYVPRYRDPYYNDEGYWQQRCYTQYEYEFNYAYGNYDRVPRTVCRWVHTY